MEPSLAVMDWRAWAGGLTPGRGRAVGCLWSLKRFLPGRQEGGRGANRGTVRGVLGGSGCWLGRWQQPSPGSWGDGFDLHQGTEGGSRLLGDVA